MSVLVDVLHIVERQARIVVERNLNNGTPESSTSIPAASQTSSSNPTASSAMSNNNNPSGPTSSPLLFFVALGFGVVFTNLWIIVGVKYCFRYNARNRAIRNGEEVDPINLETMPRPHRRRREKKLMTMDEVNERFPLTKYKNWVASRAREGLPTTGGVTAPPSRAGSVRDVDGVMPSSPTGTKHSVDTRPKSTVSEGEAAEVTVPPSTLDDQKPIVEGMNRLEEVQTSQTTATNIDKHATVTGEEEEDEDDHIHTAVPPEMLTNPGDSCAICIDTLEEEDDIRGLTCGHAFHAGCLDPWLTSRRACCPLCKADYYTPKPRPEGEGADADRTGRRRTDRTNIPTQPQSAWTGIRGNPRLMLLGRTAGPMYADQNYDSGRRSARRAQRRAAAEANPFVEDAGAQQNEQAAAPRRFALPSISNPFRNMSMPRLPGRNRQAAETAAEPSPSQLESGVVH